MENLETLRASPYETSILITYAGFLSKHNLKRMKKLVLLLLLGAYSLKGQEIRTNKNIVLDYGLFYTGLFSSTNASFGIHHLAFSKKFHMKKSSMEVGPHAILIRDKLNAENQNHLGIRARYFIVESKKIVPFLSIGPYISTTNLNIAEEEKLRIHLKGAAGIRFIASKHFFLTGELGNYRFNFLESALILHPSFGLGIIF